MRNVFEQTELCGIQLKNRIIRSATHEGMGDENGRPQKTLIPLYEKLAKGGVGAIISGVTAIEQNGKNATNATMIDRDEYIEDYKALVNTAHAHDVPVIMQISHAGRQTYASVTGETPVAPSAIKDKVFSEGVPWELTEDQIKKIISNFIYAIIRARKAGFDGVQLHAAHGYLLSQFLSPYMNIRNDKWGGNTENRFRILAEIFRGAQAKVGNYPLLVKLSASDGCENGMQIDEAVRIARYLQNAGCGAIEVSCGVAEDGLSTVRTPEVPVEAVLTLNPAIRNMPAKKKEMFARMLPQKIQLHKPIINYNVADAEQIKNHVDIPVIVVGGIRKLTDIEDIIGRQQADFVSLCRPLIIEPDLVNQFQSGVQDESRCINCGFCLYGCLEHPLRCYYGKAPGFDRTGRKG